MQTLTQEQIDLYGGLAVMDRVDGLSNEDYETYVATIGDQIEVQMSSSGGAFPDVSSATPQPTRAGHTGEMEMNGSCGLDPSCSGC